VTDPRRGDEPPFIPDQEPLCGVPSTIWHMTCGLAVGHADQYHRKAPGDPHGWRFTNPDIEAEAVAEYNRRQKDWDGY
jgi:hypothetical protein